MKHKLVAGVSLLAILACLSWAFSDAPWLEENGKKKTSAFPEEKSKAKLATDSANWASR